ncbi:MAG: threonine/serine dehydratase [bacterium]
MTAKIVQLPDMLAARKIISGRVHRTPMVRSSYFSERTHTELYLKLELFQKTGSFKVRGVSNKLSSLSGKEKKQGVISLSAGNHAQAVAWGAAQFGIPATLIMPEKSVQSKLEATRGYGGEVLTTAGNLLDFCLSVQKERGLLLIHPFDDPMIIAGHSTAGLEIIEEVPEVDYVIVGVGGGGLISGISAAIKAKRPQAKVIGVEPEGAPTMTRSLEKGVPVHLETLDTVADGLAAPFVGQHNLEHVRKFVDDLVLVSDAEILHALKLIWERCKVLAEPAGAASMAALLSNKVKVPAGATVVCMISGGNVDLGSIHKLINSSQS